MKKHMNPETMTANLTALSLTYENEEYKKEFKERLKLCGAEDKITDRVFEYTKGIYERPDSWGYDSRRQSSIRPWVFRPGSKIFSEPLLQMVEEDKLTFSEVMRIYDEAQWHYQNSRERDFIPEAWEEVEEASGHSLKAGEKFYLDREIEKLAELGMTMEQAQRLMAKEQDLLFKYKWNQKAERPYTPPQSAGSRIFSGIMSIFLMLLGAVFMTPAIWLIYMVKTVGTEDGSILAVGYMAMILLFAVVLGIFLLKKGIKGIRKAAAGEKKQENLGKWREPVQENISQKEEKNPRNRAVHPYENADPQKTSLWQQERKFIEILFSAAELDGKTDLYSGDFGIDTRSGIPYYIDIFHERNAACHIWYDIKERISWHELQTYAEKLKYNAKYLKNINEDNWRQRLFHVHSGLNELAVEWRHQGNSYQIARITILENGCQISRERYLCTDSIHSNMPSEKKVSSDPAVFSKNDSKLLFEKKIELTWEQMKDKNTVLELMRKELEDSRLGDFESAVVKDILWNFYEEYVKNNHGL